MHNPNADVERLAVERRWYVRFTWNHLKDEVQADAGNLAASAAFTKLLHTYNADLEHLIRSNSRLLKRVQDLTAWSIMFVWDNKAGLVREEVSRIVTAPALVEITRRFGRDLTKLIQRNRRMLA